MSRPKVYLRADGNSKIGLGHVYRLLALAEKLNGDFETIFVIREPSESIRKLIRKYCSDIFSIRVFQDYSEEADYLCERLFLEGNEIVVLDGYFFDSGYQLQLMHHIGALVCIDDTHSFHFYSDYVINIGGENLEEKYSGEFYTKYLFGFKYSLIRKEFNLSARKNDEENVLICLGGADPENYTTRILNECLSKRPEFNYHIVLGSAFLHETSLEKSANVHVHKNLSSEQFAFLMKNCRYGICSASTTSYEYLSTGGILYLIQTAPNQKNIYDYLLSKKVAADYNDFLTGKILTPELINNQKKFIAQREEFSYNELFHRIFDINKYAFRLAGREDCKMYFNWTNDPETRAQSFSSEPVKWEDHVKWFESKLNSSSTILLVLTDSKNSLGQLRFETEGETATINYSIAPEYRGKGFGKLIIEKAVRYLMYMRPHIKTVVGLVKEKNPASQKAFLANRFKEEKSFEQECSELKYSLHLK